MNKKYIKVFLVFLIGILIVQGGTIYAATKDTKKPTISISNNTSEYTNKDVTLTITIKDNVNVKTAKWLKGKKSITDFRKSGTKLSLTKSKSTLKITGNGTYTIYAIDSSGNEIIKTIVISKIDKKLPTITIKQKFTNFINKDNILTINVSDKESGISSVKWLNGIKKASDFLTSGTNLKLKNNTGELSVSANGYYTFLVTDKAGNTQVLTESVVNIDKAVPELTLTNSHTDFINHEYLVMVNALDSISGIDCIKYLPSNVNDVDNAKWLNASEVKNFEFIVNNNTTYSVLVADKAGNKTISTINISNIDTLPPSSILSYTVMNRVGTVQIVTSDDLSQVKSIQWLKGNVDINSKKWQESANDVSTTQTFEVNTSDTYSVLVTDFAGNMSVSQVNVTMELNAVWITYLEYGDKQKTYSEFTKIVNAMFDRCKELGMNAVIVQVRPFSDAMYKSKYFPWSKHISGTQGVNPGYDPLEYMIKAAHDRNLQIHAWINPYRVTSKITASGTDSQKLATILNTLSSDNPAKKWLTDSNKDNDRNVLFYDNALYYNPSSSDVQKLIINGVKEIISNYNVDGIHFDDYFYPSLGTKASITFDNLEYDTYVKTYTSSGKIPLSIADWRRNNVSTLVKNTYKAIKMINPSIRFGISPAGNITNLTSNTAYFVDIKKWLSSPDYVDYICPQLYWGFENTSAPFSKMVDQWVSIRTSKTISLYIGIPTYKAGSSVDVQNGVSEWATNKDVLARQIIYCRDTNYIDGFMHYRYDSFNLKITQTEIKNLLDILSSK